jgi:hypothetical protein
MAAFIFLSIYKFLPSTLYFFLYTSFEYFSFTYLILLGITNKRIKQIILFFSICFAIFQIATYLLNSEYKRLDSISVGIETILIFIYIFLFFYDHSKNNKAGFIYNHPTFWLCVGILLYLGGSFFFNILANYMSSAELQNYWEYASVAELLKNLFFVVAMLIAPHQHKLTLIHQSQVPYLDIDIE